MLIKDTDFIDKPVLAKGKVRNIYDLGDSLLLVVTDRISAFDVIFDELIPDKGRVLSSISAFWFDFTKDIIPNHVITTDVSKYPMGFDKYKEELEGRSMLVKKAEMLPAECIVRGYLEGSALKEYNKSGTVGGIKMPEGMVQGDKLPEPLFTPSTKADEGHDINITYEQLVDLIGEADASALRDASIALYTKVSEFALTKGLILADTKFEFGKIDGVLTVCDEMFTPDSSRFWDASEYEPGHAQKSFDKQFLREWLETLDWDKTYPAPHLPEEIISKTAEKYRECYSRITGKEI
ncbi:MAG: phosphoribosylaminoimidazolesuccinocarboxamide synthase [Saccharofermentans sp.]|jgi:phosphoribosylaminoimidazole-succinocarboxamide synthase|nr:phosphoribosylaminoimidazolesuccinocarboxamide synthase [Saccharofermentans sp.]